MVVSKKGIFGVFLHDGWNENHEKLYENLGLTKKGDKLFHADHGEIALVYLHSLDYVPLGLGNAQPNPWPWEK